MEATLSAVVADAEPTRTPVGKPLAEGETPGGSAMIPLLGPAVVLLGPGADEEPDTPGLEALGVTIFDMPTKTDGADDAPRVTEASPGGAVADG